MPNSVFSEDIIYIAKDQMTDGPLTPGQPRQTAFETDGVWAGVTTVIAKDTPSQWHHHADHDSIMYMLTGQIRVDWGVTGEKSFLISPGDFAFFKRGVIHRAKVIEGDQDCTFAVVRIGKGETVINVAGPGANVDVTGVGEQ